MMTEGGEQTGGRSLGCLQRSDQSANAAEVSQKVQGKNKLKTWSTQPQILGELVRTISLGKGAGRLYLI